MNTTYNRIRQSTGKSLRMSAKRRSHSTVRDPPSIGTGLNSAGSMSYSILVCACGEKSPL